MPEIKHNFTKGKMNKDLDERLVPNGEYRDAMNIQVSTSEGSHVGTVQNILGTIMKTVVEETVMLTKSTDEAFVSFNQATGMIDEYGDGLKAAEYELRASGVSIGDLATANAGLIEGFREFTTLTGEQQQELIETTGLLDKMGVSSDAMAKNMESGNFKEMGGSSISQMMKSMSSQTFTDVGGSKLVDMAKNMESDNFKDMGGGKIAELTKHMTSDNFKNMGGEKLADMTKNIGSENFSGMGGEKIAELAKNMAGDNFKDMGGQTIATKSDGDQRALWPGGPMGTGRSKFKIVAKMDSRSTQDVVKYIEKTFPKNVIEEVELDEKTKWRRGDGRPRGAAHIENERFWDLPKSELEYIIKDAGEAMRLNPTARKATTGRGNWADQVNDAHTVLGWRRKNSIKEASARADAMKAMRRSGEFKDKDDDDIRATDADEKAASKNILVQMKSAADLPKGGEIEFLDKKKVKVPQKVAILFVRKYMSLRRPADKAKFQAKASKSYKDFVSAMKESFTVEHTILDRIHSKIQERKNG